MILDVGDNKLVCICSKRKGNYENQGYLKKSLNTDEEYRSGRMQDKLSLATI